MIADRLNRLAVLGAVGWVLVSAAPVGASTAPAPCVGGPSSADVKITDCTYAAVDSNTGIANFYLQVIVRYEVSRPIAAVRFIIDAGDGRKFEVDRQAVSPGNAATRTFQLYAPPAINHVTVWVDGAS